MIKQFFLLVFCVLSWQLQAQKKARFIHVFVALCDNENQGIVPVPSSLGNGQDAKSNLYWGALYGVKTHFKRSAEWVSLTSINNPNPFILERVLFKHRTEDVYLLADAYNGAYIKQTTIDFLEASAGGNSSSLDYKGLDLSFGGEANLLAYVGHDGLMEFDVEGNFNSCNEKSRDAIMLACISKEYFKPYIQQTKANPLVWSTGLMSPEAYTLHDAIEGWILEETSLEIRERAAQAYHKYQKCGIKGARGLLVTGF